MHCLCCSVSPKLAATGQPIWTSAPICLSLFLVATKIVLLSRAATRSVRIVSSNTVLPDPLGPRISTCSGSNLPSGYPHDAMKSGATSDQGARGVLAGSACTVPLAGGTGTATAEASATAAESEGGGMVAAVVSRNGVTVPAARAATLNPDALSDVMLVQDFAERLQLDGQLEPLHEPAARGRKERDHVGGVAENVGQGHARTGHDLHGDFTADGVPPLEHGRGDRQEQRRLGADVLADRVGDAGAAAGLPAAGVPGPFRFRV